MRREKYRLHTNLFGHIPADIRTGGVWYGLCMPQYNLDHCHGVCCLLSLRSTMRCQSVPIGQWCAPVKTIGRMKLIDSARAKEIEKYYEIEFSKYSTKSHSSSHCRSENTSPIVRRLIAWAHRSCFDPFHLCFWIARAVVLIDSFQLQHHSFSFDWFRKLCSWRAEQLTTSVGTFNVTIAHAHMRNQQQTCFIFFFFLCVLLHRRRRHFTLMHIQYTHIGQSIQTHTDTAHCALLCFLNSVVCGIDGVAENGILSGCKLCVCVCAYVFWFKSFVVATIDCCCCRRRRMCRYVCRYVRVDENVWTRIRCLGWTQKKNREENNWDELMHRTRPA